MQCVLNNFHCDIKFTNEIEIERRISFLDVKVVRNENGYFTTEVSRKLSDTNVYLHWKSFAPIHWKIGTLKGLFRSAYIICSEKTGLEKELKHLKFVFTKINGFPSRIVSKSLYQVKKSLEREQLLSVPENADNNSEEGQNSEDKKDLIHPYIVLPYKGNVGNTALNELKSTMKKFFPKNIKPRFSYHGKKIGSFFPIKDKIDIEHQTNLVYELKKGYIGETSVRYGKRISEHAVDKNSSIYKDSIENNYDVSKADFKILGKGFQKTRDRKLAEALFIKDKKPILNEQKQSYKLQLFN